MLGSPLAFTPGCAWICPSEVVSPVFQDPVPLFKVYAEELVSQLKEQAQQKQ